MRILILSSLLLSAPLFAAPGDSAKGLTADEIALFEQGKIDFEHEFTAVEGAGPLYNRFSCVACHGATATGGSDPDGVNNNANHFFIRDLADRYIPGHEFGGDVAQERTTSDNQTPDCQFPADAPAFIASINPLVHVSTRHTPAVWGFGYLDAVPDRRITDWAGRKRWKVHNSVIGIPNYGVEMEGLARSQDITIDPIPRTRVRGPYRVGRFGWKAQTPTLFQFSAEPFNVELGVTSPFFPRENAPSVGIIPGPECDLSPGVVDDTDGTISASLYYFQAFTEPPARGHIRAREVVGELVFASIGCMDCHRRRMKTDDYHVPWTDGTAHKVKALSNKNIYPYSDLLIHDLGDANDDRRQMGTASGRLWRTTPLWGLRHKTNFWHDGDATSVEEAIYRHDGEAAAARDDWDQLPGFLKGLVLDFMNSL